MIFSGRLSMDFPRHHAIAAFHNPEILQLLLPVTGTVTPVDGTHFDLLLTPNTPLFKATLAGTLVIIPVEPNRIYQLEGLAKVKLVGSVALNAELVFDGDNSACVIAYTGTLKASGVLARLINSRKESIRAILEQRFELLRQRIIATRRAAERAQAAR